MGGDFTSDQKRYLEGFVSGMQAIGGAKAAPAAAASIPTGPDATHLQAQDVVTAGGGKLVDQEKWKRAEHPFDAYPRLKAQAKDNAFPKPEDNFRWRYFGLFYVAPAQSSYMVRLRIPNGILNHWQFAGMADVAERMGGGYAHVTTRANLQIREVMPDNAPRVVEAIQDLGLCSRGSGADNIRNVTGSATAGIDPQELVDTRPLAREWHHHILNDRSLYGLPRKFNVAFDGGGLIATLEETNDIGFQAVRIGGEIWFRLVLGGITGHRDLARPTGVFCKAEECCAIADAIVRVFIDKGDRTNRTKARMKYVLDAISFETYLEAVEAKLGRTLTRLSEDGVEPRPAFDRLAHIGVHPQSQPGLNWIGVTLPVGRMDAGQMRGLAAIARDFGDGDIRLTVWQNLLISGVPDGNVADAKAAIEALGLDWKATSLRAGLVACTGATGCKFAAAHTKEHALEIADHVDARLADAGLALDVPVNVHLTGCHHSCAQHYIGDIGLIGAKVTLNEEGDQAEGYSIVVGGGYGDQARIGRELWKEIRAEDCPGKVEGLLRAYLERREGPAESFQAFTSRHEPEALRGLVDDRELAGA
ncbi:ferredoxin--nitrite reductase [Labrys sp. WJW]|uniref:NirA family protein n=1 Tax=Labrys sp. WJW TaxID=1737983 RepID=UPI000831569E|nr:NirA family protein [Labrys sp. WJW]OCC06035.1 ferredoxin--nitrite reductase [Labrys sp. WJW]